MPANKMNILLSSAAALCCFLPAFAGAPALDTAPAAIAARDAKIAFLGPLSGENADLGEKMKKGICAALKMFNDTHGSNISILELDTSAAGASAGGRLAAAAYETQVLAAIGPVTTDGLPDYISGANSLKLPLVSPTVLFPDDIPGNRYFFRNNLAPEDEGRRLGRYAVKSLGRKKLAVIRNDSLFSSRAAAGFTEGVLEAGGSVEKEVLTVSGQYDLKEQMLALGGMDPHVVKELTDTDKLNLDAVAARFIAHVRAFIPQSKTVTRVIVLNFTNTGAGGRELREESDRGSFFARKLSFGLAKFRDIEMIEMAKVYAFLKTSKSDMEGELAGACAEFQADYAVTGSIIPLTPGAFKASARIVNLSGETVAEISFPFRVSVIPQGNKLGVEAFYIPQDTADSDNIISHLAFFDLKSTCLGTSKWFDEKLLLQPSARLEGAAFTAAFFAGSEDPAVSGFASLYRSIYFEEPEELASFGYEAASIILSGIGKGVKSREGMENFLVSLNGYGGLNGSIAFSGGRFVKSPRILTTSGGTVSEIRE